MFVFGADLIYFRRWVSPAVAFSRLWQSGADTAPISSRSTCAACCCHPRPQLLISSSLATLSSLTISWYIFLECQKKIVDRICRFRTNFNPFFIENMFYVVIVQLFGYTVQTQYFCIGFSLLSLWQEEIRNVPPTMLMNHHLPSPAESILQLHGGNEQISRHALVNRRELLSSWQQSFFFLATMIF